MMSKTSRKLQKQKYFLQFFHQSYLFLEFFLFYLQINTDKRKHVSLAWLPLIPAGLGLIKIISIIHYTFW